MGGYGANGGGEPSYGDGGDYGDDGSHGGRRQSGRWIRRGHKIVLLGI
jgi:hypothetical protein